MLLWKSHRGLILFCALLSGAFQFLIIWLIATFDYASGFEAFLKHLPPQFQAIFNEEFITRFSVSGAAAFGLNHPIVLALLALTAIAIPARHIAGEIEGGTLELLLAYPVRRTGLIISLWVSTGGLILLVVLGACVGAFSAMLAFAEVSRELIVGELQIAANLWLLFMLVASYTLLLSSFGKEGSRVANYSAAITLIFYFLHIVTTIWESIGFMKPFSIFAYYLPQKVMFGERSFGLNAAVLAGLIAICLATALIQFRRRDIPG